MTDDERKYDGNKVLIASNSNLYSGEYGPLEATYDSAQPRRPPLPTLAELVPRYVESLIRSGDIERMQKKAAKVDADGRWSDPAIVYRDANHAVVMLAVDLAKETRKQLKKEADDEE